jgi:hypothetical protein
MKCAAIFSAIGVLIGLDLYYVILVGLFVYVATEVAAEIKDSK